MSLLSLISLLLASSLALPLAAAPLTLGIWILILGFLSGATISIINSSWIGIITVLIYIGGLNVLFAYFAATAPNNHLFISPIINVTLFSSTTLILNMLLYPLTIFNANSYHWTSQFKEIFIGTNVLILLSLGLILFLALVIVVNVANRASGPLRPFS